jgi:hypothetical protein
VVGDYQCRLTICGGLDDDEHCERAREAHLTSSAKGQAPYLVQSSAHRLYARVNQDIKAGTLLFFAAVSLVFTRFEKKIFLESRKSLHVRCVRSTRFYLLSALPRR